MQLVSQRKFKAAIDPLYKIILVSKQLIDPKPTIYFYQMYGCLLMYTGYLKESYTLFEIAKDIAHDAQNLAQELVCFEWMGRVQSELMEFD